MKQRLLQGTAAAAVGAPPGYGAHEKATAALEKATIAFDKAVNGVKSLAGTGSGKVPLLLPATYLNRNNHHDSEDLDNGAQDS